MARRTYYIVCCNDGCPLSKELTTKKEAIKEMKSIIKEDTELLGEDATRRNDYYINKYVETDTTIYESEVVRNLWSI